MRVPVTSAPPACNLCGSRRAELIRVIKEPDRFECHFGITPESYRREWWRCQDCGVAFNVLQPQSAELVERIGEVYYDIDLGGYEGVVAKYERVMGLPPEKSNNYGRVSRVAERLARMRKSPVDVLDIGAGLGVFLMLLGERSAVPLGRCVAVETDPYAIRHLRSLGPIEVDVARFPSPHHGTGFDLIALNNVAEHIRDPTPLLCAAREHLSEGGVLYVEVPDLRAIAELDDAANALGCLHYNLYDVDSLTGLLTRCGFLVEHSQPIEEPSGDLEVYAMARRG